MIRKVAALALALALVLGAVSALAITMEETRTVTMYVYTDNGKSLNVRSSPAVDNNVIGQAPYGSAITVNYSMSHGWTCISWKGKQAYVQSRYLQWDKPPVISWTPTPYVTPAPTVAPYINNYNGYTDTLAVLNAEFRTARLVTPFTVIVRPSRASGWVNMRWAPSKDPDVLATYRNGAKLTVLAETQSWYQVADPDTDATGFIMKAYTTRQY